MSSSCSWGESLQFPSAYPTRCVGYFNIHPGKKKKGRASCRGTFSNYCWSFGRQRDFLLNSLVIVLQVEKESQKNTPPRPKGWCSKAKRRQRDFFPTIIKIHNSCAPPPFTSVCERHVVGSVSSAGRWQLEKQQCVYHSGCFPPRVQKKSCTYQLPVNR